jgi:pimeloyl-ACP methyl ester carboxylesterase
MLFESLAVSNNSQQEHPDEEKERRRSLFHEQFIHREKMSFACKEGREEKERMFEYIDISPKIKKGKDIFLATGTPWDWELMEDFVFKMVESGHRVLAIDHPDLGLRDSLKYKPEIRRPAAIKAFFENKNLDDITVIAHSVGFMDTLLKGQKNINGIIALNPAGLSENSPFAHWITSMKSIRLAVSKNHGTLEERSYYRKIVKAFFRQSLAKSIKETLHVGKSDMRPELEFFKDAPVIIFRNVEDSLVPVKNVFDQNFRKLESGGDHLGPFIHEDQMEEILKAVKEIEENSKVVEK